MNIQKINIEKLKEAKYNPRVKLEKTDEAYKRIKASIEEFGCVDPIIVNVKNMTVIGGHQRLNILKELGYEEIECVLLNLDEKEEKKLNLSLNKNSGYWDNSKLKQLFEELGLSEEEMYPTGFSPEEIDALTNDYISELLEDEFVNTNNELDKFSITFNIPKEHEERFKEYIKIHGKDDLVEVLIDAVEKEVI